MGRLSKLLSKASDARASLEMAVERDVNKYVERVADIDRKREDTFLRKHMDLDGHVTDLAEFSEALDDFGKNEHSGESDGTPYAGTGGNHGG